MAGLADAIRYGADLGTRIGNGLLFGQGDYAGAGANYVGRNAAAALGFGQGTTFEDALAKQRGAMDAAKQNTGAVGDVAEFAGSVLGPGELALRGAGALGKGIAAAASKVPGVGTLASKLPNFANILRTSESVGKAAGTAAKAAEGAAGAEGAAAVSAGRSLAPATSNFGPAITPVEAFLKTAANTAVKAPPTLMQQARAAVPEALRAVGQLSAGAAANDPNSGLRTSVRDFLPNIVEQAGENGPLGMMGAAVGGGLNVAKNVLFAPMPDLSTVGGFMRGATGQKGLAAQEAELAAAQADPNAPVQSAAAQANPNAPATTKGKAKAEPSYNDVVAEMMVGRSPERVKAILGLTPPATKPNDAMAMMLSQLLERQMAARLQAAGDDPAKIGAVLEDMQQQYAGALAKQPLLVAPSGE